MAQSEVLVPLNNVTFIDNYAANVAGAAFGSFEIRLATFRNNSAGVEGDELPPPSME
jgi:hypothetical protein